MSDVISTYLVSGNILRIECCDLHCDIVHCFLYSVIYNIGVWINDNADSSAAVYIRYNTAMLSYNLLKSADL